jgi:hypothetical protein
VESLEAVIFIRFSDRYKMEFIRELERISGRVPQPGLDAKTDRLTDRQSQCDFDFELERFRQKSEILHRDSSDRRRAEGVQYVSCYNCL